MPTGSLHPIKLYNCMSKILIEVNQQVNFSITTYETPVARLFYEQTSRIMKNRPVAVVNISDDSYHTLSYFQELIAEAKAKNILDWSSYELLAGSQNYHSRQINLNQMHKDLEVLAGIENYADLMDQDRQLLDEMHCCLHSLERPDAPSYYNFSPRAWINFNLRVSVEKYSIPEPIKFSRSLRPGQVALTFPYVGKEPLVCAIHQDNSLLSQTCKINEHISTAWKLYTGQSVVDQWELNQPSDVDSTLTKWFNNNLAAMNNLGYSLEKILDHTGFCVVGEVQDHSVFEYLNTTPRIKVTQYGFED